MVGSDYSGESRPILYLLDVLGDRKRERKFWEESIRDDTGRLVEQALDWVLSTVLPLLRANITRMAKSLPQRRGRGVHIKPWPDDLTCRYICRKIVDLHVMDKVPLMQAYERLAHEYGISVRMAQRIYAARDRYL
jgi:hypothetical protein